MVVGRHKDISSHPSSPKKRMYTVAQSTQSLSSTTTTPNAQQLRMPLIHSSAPTCRSVHTLSVCRCSTGVAGQQDGHREDHGGIPIASVHSPIQPLLRRSSVRTLGRPIGRWARHVNYADPDQHRSGTGGTRTSQEVRQRPNRANAFEMGTAHGGSQGVSRDILAVLMRQLRGTRWAVFSG